jgi:hypothetical protein
MAISNIVDSFVALIKTVYTLGFILKSLVRGFGRLRGAPSMRMHGACKNYVPTFGDWRAEPVSAHSIPDAA